MWKAWRGTIITVAAVIAVGSLASASPSLRAPRGADEPVSTGPTGATGLSGPTGVTGPEMVPVEETEPVETAEGADFGACEGLTGLDNAICRHEALLVVHPDNKGLQNSLGHLKENEAKHEGAAEDGSGGVPSDDGSSAGGSSGHGQSGESHGNGGGNGNAGGNGNGH